MYIGYKSSVRRTNSCSVGSQAVTSPLPTRKGLVSSRPVPSTAQIAEVDMDCLSRPRSTTTTRVTIVQAATVFYNTYGTLNFISAEKAEGLIAQAASAGSELVVFPEAFVGGYPRGSTFGASGKSCSARWMEEFRKYHAAAIDVPGAEVSYLAQLAGRYGIYLVMGVVEREGYTLYSTVLFFNDVGEYLGKHRKIVPTGFESLIWRTGDGCNVMYRATSGKIGALISWENKLPPLRTALYGEGVQIYCAPTSDSGALWQASMTHIALEGGCFVLSANQFCRRKDYPPPPEYVFAGPEEEEPSPDSVVCPGGSAIISPSGKALAGPHYEGEAVITATLDLGDIALAKFHFDVVGYSSRPELLSLTVEHDPPCVLDNSDEKNDKTHK